MYMSMLKHCVTLQ